MSVVQITVQSAAGQRSIGAAAASVMFSRSVGAAFGTAIVGAVLFGVLASMDATAGDLFRALIERGPAAMADLAPARQVALKAEIADAFRAAFAAIAGFSVLSLFFAWSVPLRRI